MYRWGITPWERYGRAAAGSIAALLDRVEAERSRPLGRALDVGCGRGQFTPELARRGWQATGIDYVPAAIEASVLRCWSRHWAGPFDERCPDCHERGSACDAVLAHRGAA